MSTPLKSNGSSTRSELSGRRRSGSLPKYGGVIVDEELAIPVPAPENCYPALRRSSSTGRGNVRRRHSSVDVMLRAHQFQNLEPKPSYVLHRYGDDSATSGNYSGNYYSTSPAKQRGGHSPNISNISLVRKEMEKKVGASKSKNVEEKLLFPEEELRHMLRGYNIVFETKSNYSKADYYLLFSEKAYAKKHLVGAVEDLSRYTLEGDEGFLTYLDLRILQVNGNLSVRISLRKELREIYYKKMIHKINHLAVGSTDLPFPSNPRELTEAQKKRLLYRGLMGVLGKRGQRLPEYLFPTHRTSIRNQIWKNHSSSVFHFIFGDVNEKEIADYFGEELALYFAWMNHYKRWLFGASIFGLITVGAGKFFRFSADSNCFAPFYTILLILGTVLCVKMWERRCSTLFMELRMLHNQIKDGNNWQFKGKYIVDSITGLRRLHYPEWKRGCILQPVSWFIALIYMSFTFFISICSANLDGMIAKDSRLAVEYIRRLSDPGQLCAGDSALWWVPSAVYSLSVMALSTVFGYVARKLTELENYEHRGDYICSFTQKRVALETINRYSKLLFVVFVCQDLEMLSMQVKSIFITAELIRIFTETVFPFLITYRTKLMSLIRKSDLEVPEQLDENLQVYEVYQDFVEMALQLGYIALFATAYPIAPVIALLSNFVEAKSDLFKICYVVRRPVPRYGSSQLSTWCGVFRLFATGAVVTNTFLFVFTGSQMRYLLPSYFSSPGEGAGVSSDSVMLFTILEHILTALCVFLFWRISVEPKAVKEYKKKQHYNMAKSSF